MARPLSSLPASVLSSREASAPGTALATSGTCCDVHKRAYMQVILTVLHCEKGLCRRGHKH
jgi:hypothetical protein